MGRAKRARTAETPKQPSPCLMPHALHFYPDRDRKLFPGADAVCVAQGNTFEGANASARTTRRGRRPWHARTLLVREPGDLGSDQSQSRAGPRREGEEP
jgi:hypothetical protein